MSSDGRVESLLRAHGQLDGKELIAAISREFPGRLAVVSSFGAESAVLLDLVAQVDHALPVIFLDTDALFDETIDYRDRLINKLGLTGVRIVRPDTEDLKRADELWRVDSNMCCHLRKVLPLERATRGFKVLVDGRKRFHGGGREVLETIGEGRDGIITVSPLAPWSQERIDSSFVERDLPRHPLTSQGYSSIGCWPCTRATKAGKSPRAGRWAGSAKTECGIHLVTA